MSDDVRSPRPRWSALHCLLGMSGDVSPVSAVFRPPRPSLQRCPKYRAQAASDPGLQHQGPLQQWLVVMQTSILSHIYAFYKSLNRTFEPSLSDIFSTLICINKWFRLNVHCTAGRGLESCSNEEPRHLLAILSFMTQLSLDNPQFTVAKISLGPSPARRIL